MWSSANGAGSSSGFYSPQLTPSTPSAPSVSYAYPQSTHQSLASKPVPQFNLNTSGRIRMAQSGASTPVPTSPVVGPLARSSSMMDLSYDKGQGAGQAARWNRAGFGGMGMGMTSGNAQGSSPIDLKIGSRSNPSPPPTSAHPSSFEPSPGQLGIGTSSNSSGSHHDPERTTAGESAGLAMSISPPSWGSWGKYAPPSAAVGSGSYGTGNVHMGSWGGVNGAGGSFIGSLGQMGQSFGRERDRELEARYVRDFSCCGRQLNGLHELLEHYEEEHANLSPDARFAALSAAHAPPGAHRPSFTMPNPSVSSVQPSLPRNMHNSNNNGADDVPAPPGMMDIEMEDDSAGPSSGSNNSSVPGRGFGTGFGGNVNGGFGMGLHGQQQQQQHQVQHPQQQQQLQQQQQQQHSPWASAFRPVYAGSTGIPPSLLTMPATGIGGGSQPSQLLQTHTPNSQFSRPNTPSMAPFPLNPSGSGIITPSASAPPSRSSTPLPAKVHLTQEELDARAARKAQRKADRQAQAKRAAENGEEGSGEEGAGGNETEKKFPCPIEGCGKVYKQANGLKYHLTRSINSGHGNVAEMGLPAGALGVGS